MCLYSTVSLNGKTADYMFTSTSQVGKHGSLHTSDGIRDVLDTEMRREPCHDVNEVKSSLTMQSAVRFMWRVVDVD